MAVELGNGYVQIIPSAKGIKGSIENVLAPEAASAGKKSGESIGAGLVGSLKGVLAAAGIGAAIKATLDEGAKIQQSYGGLETIYGDAAEAAKVYAEQAYAAGISANDYAEQAVSFGASLKQAFKGDTAKAVEAANTAILDMTDNAAKMGTPIENIQNAYQGFAKGNYTMLDNLKLGYGGTQKEMERLLADAQKLSGVEYKLDNLGDVYAAIHVIQGELGLTGVAAAEAEGTFSGSMGAMQASLQNLMGALSTGGDIQGPLTALINNATTFLVGNLVPMLTNIITALPGAFTTALPLLVSAVQDLFTQLQTYINADTLTAGTEALTSFINGLIADLPGLVSTGLELLTSFLGSIVEALPQVLETGGTILTSIVTGLIAALPGIIDAATKTLGSFLDTVTEKLPDIISAGGDIIKKLISGIWEKVPDVMTSVGNLLGMIVTKIALSLPDILKSGIDLVAKLIEGALSMIPNLVKAAGDLVTALWNAIKNIDWKELGTAIIDGVKEGIKAAAGRLAEAATEACNGAKNTVKKFFGIESPSKVFRDEVGAMMAEGIAVGFEENVPTAEIRQSLQPLVSVVPDTLPTYSYGGFSINVYGAPGQNVQQLADLVGSRINEQIYARKAVFA